MPNRVYDLVTFLQAQEYQFQEVEGQPPNDDPPNPIPLLRINGYKWAC